MSEHFPIGSIEADQAEAVVRRLLEINPNGAIQALLETPFWPPNVRCDAPYPRIEDASEDGTLHVCVRATGDVTVIVSPSRGPGLRRGVEFKTEDGGGLSPRTARALKILAAAIALDNDFGHTGKKP